MDRCALFVDAGYVLADGSMAVHGTRRRESVSWDYGGLLQLLAGLAMERSRLPLLRCYWYEATVEGQRSDDHEALADLPGVKLRVAKMWPGRREGAEIQRDLTTLARNKAVSDAMVVSAEENLAKVISDVQDMGMRVTLLNIAIDGDTAVSRVLRQECDDIVEIGRAHLRPYVELIPGAEPAQPFSLSAAQYPEYPDYQRAPAQQEQAEDAAESTPADAGAPAAAAAVAADTDNATASAVTDSPVTDSPVTDYAVTDYAGGGERGADYGSVPDYGQAAQYVPATHDSGAAAPESASPRQDQAFPRQDTPVRQAPAPAPAPAPPAPQDRVAAHEARQSRQDHGLRRAESPVRNELYAAPVAVPAAEELAVERQPSWPLQETGPRPVESGYNPGAVRERFQPDAVSGDPQAGNGADWYQQKTPVPISVPASPAQVRHLPARGPGQPGGFALYQSAPAAGPTPGPQAGMAAVPADNRGMGYAGQVPAAGPVAPVPSPVQAYSGGQSGVSLADAVQSAHEEGQAFGESVARDAPALWLEAVLARKPRMPSDLEARLLQGSALPIDFLLHDEVRHALRRGFWDALERSRR